MCVFLNVVEIHSIFEWENQWRISMAKIVNDGFAFNGKNCKRQFSMGDSFNVCVFWLMMIMVNQWIWMDNLEQANKLINKLVNGDQCYTMGIFGWIQSIHKIFLQDTEDT